MRRYFGRSQTDFNVVVIIEVVDTVYMYVCIVYVLWIYSFVSIVINESLKLFFAIKVL
jgi:hypothetical protein